MYLFSMGELESIKNQKEVLYIDEQTGLQVMWYLQRCHIGSVW